MFIITDNHDVELYTDKFKLITFETRAEAESYLDGLIVSREIFSVKEIKK